MIQNIMEFTDTEAKDIMTHRKNVIAFDEEDNLQTIVYTCVVFFPQFVTGSYKSR